MIGLSGEVITAAAAAVVESEGADAEVIEFMSDADHIAAAVGATEAVQEECDMVTAFPGDGGIIVDNEEVAVIESQVSFGGSGERFAAGEEGG